MVDGDEVREMPDWDERYRDDPVEEMPWFFSDLDPDVGEALDARGVSEGEALDLGTGPGTQAIELAQSLAGKPRKPMQVLKQGLYPEVLAALRGDPMVEM